LTTPLQSGAPRRKNLRYGRTTLERIFNFKCVTFERILPVVCLGNLISKNVKNRNKSLYAKNILLAHHFGKKKLFACTKNIIIDMGRIPLFQYD
jgi:hypothetical protein